MIWEERHVKEIQDFTSASIRKAAEFYHLLSQLLLRISEPPDDCEEGLEKVNKYKLVLPKIWEDMADAANGMSVELTWERLKIMIQEVVENPEYQKWVEGDQPEFEFGTQQKRKQWTVSGDHDPRAKRSNDKWKRASDDEEEPYGSPSERTKRPKIEPKSAGTLTSAEMEDDEDDDDGSIPPPPTAPYNREEQTQLALEELRRQEELDQELGL